MPYEFWDGYYFTTGVLTAIATGLLGAAIIQRGTKLAKSLWHRSKAEG